MIENKQTGVTLRVCCESWEAQVMAIGKSRKMYTISAHPLLTEGDLE